MTVIFGVNSVGEPVPVLVGDNGSLVSEPVASGQVSSLWTKLKQWNANTDPDAFNLVPTTGTFVEGSSGLNSNCDFIPLTGWDGVIGASKIEVLPRIKTTSPVASIRIYLWVQDQEEEIYQLGAGGGNPGENAYSVLVDPFKAVAPFVFELDRGGVDLKLQVRISVDIPYIVFGNDGGCANPGFVGGELVTLGTTGFLPYGLGGYILSTDWNAANDTVIVTGVTFAANEAIRVNLQSIGANVIPPLGISARIRAAQVNTLADAITLDATVNNTQTVFANGDTVRFRAAPGSTLFSLLGAGASATTTYTLINVSGSVGAQSFQLSTDGTTPLTVTAQGIGYFYVFKYPFIPMFFKGTNQLSYTSGGTAIALNPDWVNQVVTITTAGTAAVFTNTSGNHNFTIGQRLTMGGVAAPTLGTLGWDYYVLTTPLPTTYTISHTPTINIASAGSGVTANGIAVTITPASSTLPGIVNQTAHTYSTGQPIVIAAGSYPSNLPAGTYYAWVRDADHFALSTSEPLGIAFTGTGTTVNMTSWDGVVPTGNPCTLTAGTPGTIQFNTQANPVNHFLTTLQPFTFTSSSTVLPTGYQGRVLTISANSIATTTFQASEVEGGAPAIFGSTGTALKLSANISGVGATPIEKITAFIAASPAPTDGVVSFANTSNGAAIAIYGGNGTHSMFPNATAQILPDSSIKARAI